MSLTWMGGAVASRVRIGASAWPWTRVAARNVAMPNAIYMETGGSVSV